MQFLHSSTPPKIHRDLKPQNLLVTTNLRVKIADFGTAKLISTQSKKEMTSGRKSSVLSNRFSMTRRQKSFSRDSTTQIGTLPYMAPELHSKERVPYSKEIDVYSFGMTMWAVAKEDDPFNEVPEFEIVDRVTTGARPPIDESWPQDWTSLMSRCWDMDPNQRPTFDVIATNLYVMHLDDA